MKQRFHCFWSRIGSLDDKIYYTIISIGSAATLLAFLVGMLQDLSLAANVTTMFCCVWMLALLFIGMRWPKSLPVCRIILVCGLVLALPPAYFSCGGLSGGMILFYQVSLFLVAVLLRGRARLTVFLLSFAVLVASVVIGYRHPELVHTLTPHQGYQDILVTFCTTGPGLVFMTVGLLNAYSTERRHNQVLVEQLSELSKHDALSGLYNRRELFRRLELVYQPQPDERPGELSRDACCLAMFDIDDFKKLNDTHGHQFGDLVLSTVAQKFDEAMRAREGEFAARYGGEEFVCVLRAGSVEDALARMDAVRREIAAVRYTAVPELSVTVSGGVVSCASCQTLDRAMQDVDALLYEAKRSGKNRIVRA